MNRTRRCGAAGSLGIFTDDEEAKRKRPVEEN